MRKVMIVRANHFAWYKNQIGKVYYAENCLTDENFVKVQIPSDNEDGYIERKVFVGHIETVEVVDYLEIDGQYSIK